MNTRKITCVQRSSEEVPAPRFKRDCDWFILGDGDDTVAQFRGNEVTCIDLMARDRPEQALL